MEPTIMSAIIFCMSIGPTCLPCPTKETIKKLAPNICCCPDETPYYKDISMPGRDG